MNISNALIIPGWMSPIELETLAKLASKSKKIVEFGSYYGRSTRVLADNTNGVVHAVDPWVSEYYNENGPTNFLNDDSYERFQKYLQDHIANEKVVMYRSYSWEYPGRDADFVFIDGDHRYESVRRDIITAQRLVQKGIIAGHDYIHTDWPGVKKAVNEYFPKVEIVDSIWIHEF